MGLVIFAQLNWLEVGYCCLLADCLFQRWLQGHLPVRWNLYQQAVAAERGQLQGQAGQNLQRVLQKLVVLEQLGWEHHRNLD